MRAKNVSEPETAPKKSSDLFQKRQKQIIQKAMKLFMKKGYAQTSMREISKATAIDIRNLYYFIQNKEEILFLVFDRLHRPEVQMFEKKGILDIDDPVEQLRAAIAGLVENGYGYGQEVLLLYRESKSLPKRLLKNILEKESRVVSHIENILKKGCARGVFAIEDTSFTANMITYQLSLYALRKWNMKKYTKRRIIDLMEQNILKMVGH